MTPGRGRRGPLSGPSPQPTVRRRIGEARPGAEAPPDEPLAVSQSGVASRDPR